MRNEPVGENGVLINGHQRMSALPRTCTASGIHVRQVPQADIEIVELSSAGQSSGGTKHQQCHSLPAEVGRLTTVRRS
jgi:hypothetical protein